MRIEICDRYSGITNDDATYCLLRVVLALKRFEERIKHVAVRLKDENGPRGGVDKRCQLEIALHGGDELVIESAHSEIRAAIQVAAGRAKQSVARQLGRRTDGPWLRPAAGSRSR